MTSSYRHPRCVSGVLRDFVLSMVSACAAVRCWRATSPARSKTPKCFFMPVSDFPSTTSYNDEIAWVGAIGECAADAQLMRPSSANA